MKHVTIAFFILIIFSLAGCGNLSPRFQPRIDNNEGKIDEMDNIQNGLKAEIGKLKQQNEILNSQIRQMQQGMLNINHDNSGVEILSGSGGIFVALAGVIGLVFLGMTAIHYRSEAKKTEQAATILASNIVSINNPELENQVFQTALDTKAEEKVLHLMVKQQKLFRS
jgi:TolA-binding protein